jgi:energy-converting hydrogenase Eha subunit A
MISRITKYIDENNTYVKVLITIGVIAAAVASISSLVVTIPNLIKPKIKIISVDYEDAVCTLTINGKERKLYGNSTVYAGGSWGIRFGTQIPSGQEDSSYDSIELVKDERVIDYLDKKPEHELNT